MKGSSDIGRELAEKTLRELGFWLEGGKLRETKGNYGRRHSSRNPPVNSLKLPFRIPALEKTRRQAQSLQGYKASAAWQTASLLRDLVLLYCQTLPKAQFRRRTQLEDAARSMVANIEEGWARPSTKEYLDFLGFSQGSLTEVRGDIERLLTDGYLKAGNYLPRRQAGGNKREFKGLRVQSPSRNFPYPPVKSRVNPGEYGTLRERLREYTGSNVRAEHLTYEIFVELINKTDYLIRRAVGGLQSKIVREEKQKLSRDLDRIRRDW